MYIYIERERYLYTYLCIYIYIYTYVDIYRERYTGVCNFGKLNFYLGDREFTTGGLVKGRLAIAKLSTCPLRGGSAPNSIQLGCKTDQSHSGKHLSNGSPRKFLKDSRSFPEVGGS